MHAHTLEDHVFFIVQGKARFYFDDGHTEVADTYEGFLLPKGTVYRFESIGEGNLIILRVGGAQIDASWSGEFQKGWPREMRETSIVDGKGQHIKDMRSAQKGPLAVQPTVAIPGRTFPEI